MKFMVVVNQKYLVTVEANTHGGDIYVKYTDSFDFKKRT